MTDFDEKLIEKAEAMSRWDYDDIRILEAIADTDEGRRVLRWRRQEMKECCMETL